LSNLSKYLENDKNIEIGLGKIKGNIEFKNVEFYYKNSKYPSLENCNITIKEGEKVGIIGQTGAGKSTFLRILTGLDAPTKGSVYLDGHEISTIHPVEIRQNIGVMPQEPFLFIKSGNLFSKKEKPGWVGAAPGGSPPPGAVAWRNSNTNSSPPKRPANTPSSSRSARLRSSGIRSAAPLRSGAGRRIDTTLRR